MAPDLSYAVAFTASLDYYLGYNMEIRECFIV